MKQPKTVILDTQAVLERFQDYVGDYLCGDETLLESTVGSICDLLEEWETAAVFFQGVADELVTAFNLPLESVQAHAITQGVLEIAHAIIIKIEQHRLVQGGLLYYQYDKMQGYNLILKSTL